MTTHVEPTMLACGIEYSVHDCPARHSNEVQAVFPGEVMAGVLVLPTCQRAKVDLVGRGDAVEQEKDDLLEKFMAFARHICGALSSKGYWADYIDPCSGLPMVHKSGMHVYDEVAALSSLRGYRTQNAGCCKVVLHPSWGSAVYPATLFVKAPLQDVTDAIAAADKAVRSNA